MDGPRSDYEAEREARIAENKRRMQVSGAGHWGAARNTNNKIKGWWYSICGGVTMLPDQALFCVLDHRIAGGGGTTHHLFHSRPP